MNMNFRDAIKDRGSYYQLKNESPISYIEIQSIIEYISWYAPSTNNSQSARLLLWMSLESVGFAASLHH